MDHRTPAAVLRSLFLGRTAMTVVSDPGNRLTSEAPKAQPLDKKMRADIQKLARALENDLPARWVEFHLTSGSRT